MTKNEHTHTNLLKSTLLLSLFLSARLYKKNESVVPAAAEQRLFFASLVLVEAETKGKLPAF